MGTRNWLGWAALGVVYVVWGSTYLGIRLTLESMPPLLSAGLRFVAAGLLLGVVVVLVAGVKALRMTWPQFGTAALVGLLLPAWGNGLVVVAEQHVASGLAALLVASIPLYVVVLRRMLGERPPAVTLVGVAIGLAGLAVLLLGGPVAGTHGSAWFGPWLVLLAALGWSVGTVLSTRLPTPANPFALAATEMLVGGAALLLGGWVTGESLDFGATTATAWWAWGYLVVFGAFAFSSFIFALGRLPVSTVATYAYVNPLIAVILGYLVADEVFGPWQLIGGAIVLVAVILVVRAERRKVSAPDGTMPEMSEVRR
ncbi:MULTISPECIES: EamA family transporter [Actinokineospora]|uniref:EamA family transporter n=1 Tax=Actinokineospora TaxID=39845 RepID=UPI001670CDF1|nr:MULTISPECIES: EamA family transporter [Actinokineospora]UVS81010.1 putative inner membrane transporter YedA [Actinokineospora sp. UTMC 2448]